MNTCKKNQLIVANFQITIIMENSNDVQDTTNVSNEVLADVMCSFSKKELDLIAQSLMHLHNSNGEYLTWKKDEFSQQEIPKEMKRIMEVYDKVHKLRV